MDIFCENCGHKNEYKSAFCEICGKELNKEIALDNICKKVKSDKPTRPRRKKGKIATIITSIVLSVAIVAGSIFTVLHFLKKKAAQPNPLSDYNSYVYLEEGFTDVKIVDDKSAIEAVASVEDILGITNAKKNLEVINATHTGNSNYYRMQQYYNDIPVYGSNIMVAADNNGYALALTSNSINLQGVSAKATITAEEAINTLKKEFSEEILYSKPTLVFFTKPTNIENYCLAYKINISTGGNMQNFFVSADSGEILYSENCTLYERVPATFNQNKTNFYCEKISDKSYELYDSEKNLSILNANYKIININYNDKKDDFVVSCEGEKGNIISYFTKKSDVVKSTNPNWKSEKAVALMTHLNTVYDYYDSKLKLKGFNNKNGEVWGFINCNFKDNRSTNNAQSTSVIGINKTVIEFGKDKSIDLDVVAHEYTHSIIGYLINLTNGEPGAINEAYADIMGELIEDSNSWIHDNSRNIESPLDNDSPNYYKGQNWADTTDLEKDDGGVHKNSTVISHAAYLMWDQKDATNTHLLSSEKMANLWFNSIYLLQSYSDFSQCRNAVELSAKIMLKNGELTKQQYATVSSAFEEVGVDRAVCSYKYTTKNEFNLSVLVSDDSIQLDKNSHLESNFNLKVLKLNTNGSEPEEIMNEKNVSGECDLKLENGYYGLIIRDAKDENSLPLNIWIKVDKKDKTATDKIVVYTDFTSTNRELDETSSTKPNTNSSTTTTPSSKPNNSSKPSTSSPPSKPSDSTSTTTSSKPSNSTTTTPSTSSKPSSGTNKKTITQAELIGEWKLELSVDSYCDNIIENGDINSEDRFAVEFFREFFESDAILATVVFKSDGTFDMISDESLRDIFDEYVEKDSDYKLNDNTLYFEVEEGEEYGFDCEFNYTYNGKTIVFGKNVDGVDHPYTGTKLTKIK